MRVTILAAVARNGVIGRDGALPWRLPGDLTFFKQTTMGHPIVMGRKTWQSIGRPLPGRTNIVLSRGAFTAPGAIVLGSVAAARAWAEREGAPELFVIGGEQVFAEALPLADRMLLTRVDAEIEGDAHFPPFGADWVEVARVDHEIDERHAHRWSIRTLVRASSTA